MITIIMSQKPLKAGKNREHRNGMWKGDDVGLNALHEWVRNRFPKPKFCQDCGEEKRLDLANISQEYYRDLTDWEYLCRKCHMTKDGRITSLPCFSGHKHTVEARYKMGSGFRGKTQSPEHVAKRIKPHHTEESKKKQSEARKAWWARQKGKE